jgi:hypothetical protein
VAAFDEAVFMADLVVDVARDAELLVTIFGVSPLHSILA